MCRTKESVQNKGLCHPPHPGTGTNRAYAITRIVPCAEEICRFESCRDRFVIEGAGVVQVTAGNGANAGMMHVMMLIGGMLV